VSRGRSIAGGRHGVLYAGWRRRPATGRHNLDLPAHNLARQRGMKTTRRRRHSGASASACLGGVPPRGVGAGRARSPRRNAARGLLIRHRPGRYPNRTFHAAAEAGWTAAQGELAGGCERFPPYRHDRLPVGVDAAEGGSAILGRPALFLPTWDFQQGRDGLGCFRRRHLPPRQNPVEPEVLNGERLGAGRDRQASGLVRSAQHGEVAGGSLAA